MLEVTTVSKRFGGLAAVSEVSLGVREGETVAIIGPNGAGKSTFFGIIAGEHRASAGKVVFRQRDITRWSANRRARAGISRTFQVARLFPTRTVWEHLYLAASIKQGRYVRTFNSFEASCRADDEQVSGVMRHVGLASLREEKAAALAQGDRKRLELAMAVVQQPMLLLLDEPTAGMSQQDCELTVNLLGAIRSERPDLAILVTGHDMAVMFSLATRVMLMSEGQAVLDGSPAEVRANELTNRVYLGSDDV